MVEFNLLVIGLGPAGAGAAAAAAAAGLSVLGVDKRARLGEPVQCAEFVPAPLGRYANRPSVARQAIHAMRTELPSGAEVERPFPGWVVDRAAFDQAIAAQAIAAGALLEGRTRLIGLDMTARRARLIGPAGRREVGFRYLVAADGPHSTVARLLALPPLPTVATRQYSVSLATPLEATRIWLSPEYPGGYAWLFPKGARANLGLGADKRFISDLRRPLEALHRRLVAEGVVAAPVLARTGGAIPVGGLRTELVCGPVLFAGDAAGLTHPITGAGIAPAVISGEAAGAAVAAACLGGAGALADYEEDIRDQFQHSLERAVARRRLLEESWGTPAAGADATLRRGWIAFDDYFAPEPAAPALP